MPKPIHLSAKEVKEYNIKGLDEILEQPENKPQSRTRGKRKIKLAQISLNHFEVTVPLSDIKSFMSDLDILIAQHAYQNTHFYSWEVENIYDSED